MSSEQPLLSFGPLGVMVCDGPYRIFNWQWKNVFRIELTDHALRGRRRSQFTFFGHPRGGTPFDIPYANVVSVKLLPHPSPISLMRVLSVVYRDTQGTISEKSIVTYTQSAQKAFAILRQYAPQAA